MENHGNIIKVFAAILILAAPAMTIVVLSSYFDAPYLKPLALTKEDLAEIERGKESELAAIIDVSVEWGREWSGEMTQTELLNLVSNALETHTEYYSFDFNDAPGGSISVSFTVGYNTYGPFPPNRLIPGIKSALIAMKMTNGTVKQF